MNQIKCIAFDCFGTVFDMAGVSRDEIKAYAEHVRKGDFSPFDFPESWWELSLHPDSAIGVKMLQELGYCCVTLSNGSAGLLEHVSRMGGLEWDLVTDLAFYRVHKPHIEAYRVVEKETDYVPAETLLVTANPKFGDIEGAAAIGMRSQVIRREGTPQTIIELAETLGPCEGAC